MRSLADCLMSTLHFMSFRPQHINLKLMVKELPEMGQQKEIRYQIMAYEGLMQCSQNVCWEKGSDDKGPHKEELPLGKFNEWIEAVIGDFQGELLLDH